MAYRSPYKIRELRGVKNDGEGRKPHSTATLETLFAAGACHRYKNDPEARADGQGGLLRRGYYWVAPGWVTDGPYHTRRAALIAGLTAIGSMCIEDLAAMGVEL